MDDLSRLFHSQPSSFNAGFANYWLSKKTTKTFAVVKKINNYPRGESNPVPLTESQVSYRWTTWDKMEAHLILSNSTLQDIQEHTALDGE